MSPKSKQHDQFVVLLTDDNDALHSLLKQDHHSVILAKEYNEIVSLISVTHFDLILLGFTENSSELFRLIKSSDCINNKTPVIAIINPNEDAQKKRIVAMGFDDCLIRPVTQKQLHTLIGLQQKPISTSEYIQAVLSKTQNNRQLTLTIFDKLFDELPLQITGIKEALENKQYTLAEEITHKLNGSASFCGLIDIQKPAHALENCLIRKDHELTNRHFLVLQHRVLNLISHQQSIKASLK